MCHGNQLALISAECNEGIVFARFGSWHPGAESANTTAPCMANCTNRLHVAAASSHTEMLFRGFPWLSAV